MSYVLETKQHLIKDEELSDDIFVVRTMFLDKECQELFVTAFRWDEIIQIFVSENDKAYETFINPEFTFEDENWGSDFIADCKEDYAENIEMWFGDSKESAYSKEIDYVLYLLENFFNTGVIKEAENKELDEIEFVTTEYKNWESPIKNKKRGKK